MEVIARFCMVVAVVIMVTTFIGIVYAIGINRTITLSRHAVSHPYAYAALAINLTIAAALMTVFLTVWLVPTFHMSGSYILTFMAIQLCTVLVGWIPDKKGWMRTIHLASAGILFLLLPVLNLLMALNPSVGMVVQALAAAAIVMQLYYIVLFLFVPKARGNFLFFQLSYLMVSFGVLVVVTFV
jgi:hypothetical protein